MVVGPGVVRIGGKGAARVTLDQGIGVFQEVLGVAREPTEVNMNWGSGAGEGLAGSGWP